MRWRRRGGRKREEGAEEEDDKDRILDLIGYSDIGIFWAKCFSLRNLSCHLVTLPRYFLPSDFFKNKKGIFVIQQETRSYFFINTHDLLILISDYNLIYLYIYISI